MALTITHSSQCWNLGRVNCKWKYFGKREKRGSKLECSCWLSVGRREIEQLAIAAASKPFPWLGGIEASALTSSSLRQKKPP